MACTDQNTILAILKTNLEANADIVFVGNYPDDVHKIGHRFPTVLIKDADEIVVLNAGRSEEYQWNVSLYVYHNNTSARITTMNTACNSVIDTMLNDLHQSDTATNTILEEVIKGDYDEKQEDRFNAGYYPNLTVREIKFRIDYCRGRA